MIKTLGRVFLGTKTGMPLAFLAAAQFTTDPKISRAWPPRRSRLGGLNGAVTQQDFGRWAKDMRLTLSSESPAGTKNYINAAFKAYVDGLMLTRGLEYDYKDYTGTEAKVVIVDFTPEPTFIKDGKDVLYEYTMVLDVKTLSVLAFATYTGS